MPGKLAFARLGNSASAAYATYGAGPSPELAVLARDVKELEAPPQSTAVALRIASRRNTVADTVAAWAQGGD